MLTQSLSKTFSRSWPAYLFILPAVVILMLFLFIPVVMSFIISLTDWNLNSWVDKSGLHFVGIKNYIAVFKDRTFFRHALPNTGIFTMAGVILTIGVSLLSAVVLNEKIIRGKIIFRATYFLPVVCTLVAVAVIWRYLYLPDGGLFNSVLRFFHLKELKWLGDEKTALASLIIMVVWKNFGYNMVIFLAGLQSIPEALYESARIDGANAWQLFRHVTLPGLRTITFFVVIMTTIGYLQFFAEPYIMTKGGPADSTMSVVLLMYNEGFKYSKMGYASAIAYILFFVIFMFTFIQMRIMKSGYQVAGQ